jgi:hypothetical protein
MVAEMAETVHAPVVVLTAAVEAQVAIQVMVEMAGRNLATLA